jgi:dihydrofolate reductase
MGRKTYESIGKPLPKRRNIVVSTTMPVTPGVEVVRSIAEALSAASSDEQVFIIGGARLYSETISIADQLYLTRLLADYDGDTYYPDVPQTFYIAAQEDHGDFTYLTYKKRK